MKSIKQISLITMMMCFLVFPISVSGVVYVNKNATGANNGNSWADAYTTIQAGINDADVGDEEVWVVQGTYPEAIVMLSGMKLYGGFNGTETELNQRNWTTNVTTIDGSTARGGLPAYHVVIMDNITTSTIDGFTITGGNANGGDINNFGSGFLCYSLNDTNIIKNNIISGNSATENGGGISCWDNSSPNISNNTISGNSASYDGGGISCDNSSPAITNNTISGNSANYGGGGIYCYYNSSPQIKNTIFFNNNKYDIYEYDTSSDPIVIYNDFYGNPDGIYYDEGTTPYTSVSAIDSAIAECSNNIGLDPLFVGNTLSGGIWTAEPVYNSATFQTTLTNSSAAWTANEHAGRLLNPDTSQNKQFVIVSNTATTINVWSNVTVIAQSGDAYKIFDYHLQLASPCIDAGYDQDVPNIDFDGEPRPMNVLGIDNNGGLKDYDIGADEYPGVRLAATVWEFYR